jgi:hypothetical protein
MIWLSNFPIARQQKRQTTADALFGFRRIFYGILFVF